MQVPLYKWDPSTCGLSCRLGPLFSLFSLLYIRESFDFFFLSAIVSRGSPRSYTHDDCIVLSSLYSPTVVRRRRCVCDVRIYVLIFVVWYTSSASFWACAERILCLSRSLGNSTAARSRN